MRKAIVIGSSTGIGKALVFELAKRGFAVGITGRFPEALSKIKAELGPRHFTKEIDVTNQPGTMSRLEELIFEMDGCDLLIYNAGVLPVNPKLDWETEYHGAQVNVLGFQAVCNVAVKYFESVGKGHLIGISSIASLRGSGRCPTYNASKSFMSNYMEGLRQRLSQTEIDVTDIRPGFIETQMIAGRKGIFWEVSPERAAECILEAWEKRKKVAYVPKRWWWMAQLFKYLPEKFYHQAYHKFISAPDYEDFPRAEKHAKVDA